jgi:hypothetical protein
MVVKKTQLHVWPCDPFIYKVLNEILKPHLKNKIKILQAIMPFTFGLLFFPPFISCLKLHEYTHFFF